MITTVPYVYEAFSQVYAIDEDPKWLRIMQSIAEHAFSSYRDIETGPDAASCGYTPNPADPAGVVNASAYRAFLLTKAGIELSEPRYLETARRNLNFVLSSQNADGSWYYSTDGARDFVDHFHTCFVLKGTRKDRGTHGMVLLPRRDRTRDRLLREEPVRRKRPAPAIFEAAAAYGIPPGAVRLCGVYQPGGPPVWPLSRDGQGLVQRRHRSTVALAKIRWLVSGSPASAGLG